MSASPNPTGQPARTEIPVNVDVQRLKELAEKATPGPWRAQVLPLNMYGTTLADVYSEDSSAVTAGGPVEDGGDYCGASTVEDAAFIAACSPDVILALLAEVGEVTALRQQVEELQDDIEELRGTTFPKSWGGFKAFIYEVYPGDVFPDDGRELGPQFVVAARRLTEATSERDALQARLDAVLDVCLELERGANQAEYRNGGEESFTVAATRECVSTVRAAARGQEG